MAKTEQVAVVDQSVALQDLELITQGLSTLTSYKATVALPVYDKIVTQDEYNASTESVKLAKKELAAIKELRLEATRPVDKFKASIMDIEREIGAEYMHYVAVTDALRNGYLTEQNRLEHERQVKAYEQRKAQEKIITAIAEYINDKIEFYQSRIDSWIPETCVVKFEILSKFEVPACPDEFASEQAFYMKHFADKFAGLMDYAERRMDWLLKVVDEEPVAEVKPIDTAEAVAEASFTASMQASAEVAPVAFGKNVTKYIDFSIPDYSTTAIDLAALIKAYYLNGGDNKWIDTMASKIASKAKVLPTIRGIVFEEKVKPNNR